MIIAIAAPASRRLRLDQGSGLMRPARAMQNDRSTIPFSVERVVLPKRFGRRDGSTIPFSVERVVLPVRPPSVSVERLVLPVRPPSVWVERVVLPVRPNKAAQRFVRTCGSTPKA